MLSDWLGVPNLKQRADAPGQGPLRRLLWGAPPEGEPRAACSSPSAWRAWCSRSASWRHRWGSWVTGAGVPRLGGRGGGGGVGCPGSAGLLRGLTAGGRSNVARVTGERQSGWSCWGSAAAGPDRDPGPGERAVPGPRGGSGRNPRPGRGILCASPRGRRGPVSPGDRSCRGAGPGRAAGRSGPRSSRPRPGCTCCPTRWPSNAGALGGQSGGDWRRRTWSRPNALAADLARLDQVIAQAGPRRTRPRASCRGSGRGVRNAATEEQVQEAERAPRCPGPGRPGPRRPAGPRGRRRDRGPTGARPPRPRADRGPPRSPSWRPDPARRSRPSGARLEGLRAEEGYLLVCSPGWSFTARCRAS